TERAYPNCTLHELFERQAQQQPDAPAVRAGDCTLSYAVLERRSRALAALLAEAGVAHESRVGILQQRNWRLIASLFGVLRAGAAYVPLDERWPAERMQFVINDAELQIILTDRATWAAVMSAAPANVQPIFVEELRLDENAALPPVSVTPE